MAVIGIKTIEDANGNDVGIDNASLVTHPDGQAELEARAHDTDGLARNFNVFVVTGEDDTRYRLTGITWDREAPVTSMKTGAVKTIRFSVDKVEELSG